MYGSKKLFFLLQEISINQSARSTSLLLLQAEETLGRELSPLYQGHHILVFFWDSFSGIEFEAEWGNVLSA